MGKTTLDDITSKLSSLCWLEIGVIAGMGLVEATSLAAAMACVSNIRRDSTVECNGLGLDWAVCVLAVHAPSFCFLVLAFAAMFAVFD
jgi:hypothetical protein